MQSSTSTDPSQDFILSELLQNRIRAVSHGDADTAQAVALKLLELAHSDPTFAQQQPGYQITRAKWTASNLREHDMIYDRYVADESETAALLTLAGNTVFRDTNVFDEYMPAPLPSPEETVIHNQLVERLRAGFATLTPRQRQVMELKAQFYTSDEIAAELGLCKSAVSWLLKRARKQLRAVLAMNGLDA